MTGSLVDHPVEKSRNTNTNNSKFPRDLSFPECLKHDLNIILDQNGKSFAVIKTDSRKRVLSIGGKALNSHIRELAGTHNYKLNASTLKEICNDLEAHAEKLNVVTPVWRRIAPISGGVEIEIGDVEDTHVQISGTGVHITCEDTGTIFYRPRTSKPMKKIADEGNFKLLRQYVNLDPQSFMLLIAWISYTLAHPKVPTSKYVILHLKGGPGTGKSGLSKIIKRLIDPSVIEVQTLPANVKDLCISAENAHVVCFDNLRHLTPAYSDHLCAASTGSALAGRQLYTDSEQTVIPLQVALVLNGIHNFVDQPDLAQRCLPLKLNPIAANQRKSEKEISEMLDRDLPVIQRGIFDLMSSTFKHLPDARPTEPERMYDFSNWLAAMEKEQQAPLPIYQIAYRETLNESMRETLSDNPFFAAILAFTDINSNWQGTLTEFIAELEQITPPDERGSRTCWPENAIAARLRLQPQIEAFAKQGIVITGKRGKSRLMSIRTISTKAPSFEPHSE